MLKLIKINYIFQTQQLIQQQNVYLAAQLQLTRSQSLHNQQSSVSNMTSKMPAHRSLSDVTPYQFTSNQPSVRTPPGLTPPTLSYQSADSLLAQLPQSPCIPLQRRDSAKSDCSSGTDAESRYKTEMCHRFEDTNQCKYGSKCQFAHGINELRGLNRHPRYKTEFCRTFHTSGFCTYGQRCNFIHNEDERRGPAPVPVPTRPQALQLNKHLPLTVSNSIGSSPASSIYGDMSPTHSPHSLSEDPFTPNTSARLSPAPSFSSYTSDNSNRSFPSPPSTPIYSDKFNQSNFLSNHIEELDLTTLLSKLSFRQ